MIPEEKIDQILTSSDIVRIVADYYPLKPAGRNYKTLCPFHQEKTPSFIVSPEKQIFHCFGCGKGGNVFHFVMEQEKVSFPDAVKIVASKIGIQLEEKNFSSQSKLYPLMEEVNSLFVDFLHSPCGKKAYQYLLNRKIKEKTLKDFSLGFAPEGIIQAREIEKKGFPLPLLLKGGIISQKDGREYSYFRNRIIFPIFNDRGKAIAFGGRSLDDSPPKYLNSPESEIFEKGKTLYGMNLTRKAILEEKKVIVVEGYMDLISLYQEGIQNVVASLGTSLTPWQVKSISRVAGTVYLIYDSDVAGEKASLRALELCIEEGLNPLIVRLPYGEDPDSYIRKHGKENFIHNLSKSENFLSFYLKVLGREYDANEIEGKAAIVGEISRIINKIPSPIKRNEYIRSLAGEIAIPEHVLKQEMEHLKKGKIRSFEKNISSSFPNKEELILSLIIEKDEVCSTIVEEEIDDFKDENLREIAKEIYNRKTRTNIKASPSVILNSLSTEARGTFSKIMAKEFIYLDAERAIRDWRKANISRKIREGKLAPDECQKYIERLQKLL